MEWLFPAVALGLVVLALKLLRGKGPPPEDRPPRPTELDSGAWNAAMTAGALMAAAALHDRGPGDGGMGDAGGGI